MGVHRRLIDKKCTACGAQMESVSVKNPFVDDFADDCTNADCRLFHEGYRGIMSAARSIANEEARRDADFDQEPRGEE